MVKAYKCVVTSSFSQHSASDRIEILFTYVLVLLLIFGKQISRMLESRAVVCPPPEESFALGQPFCPEVKAPFKILLLPSTSF